jgi:TetR/AcrR family transcriptional repressor of nem operon
MRKSKEEAAQTRERIVSTAAAEFRRNGIVATGIADLMKAAGLTNGGFYRHFESKDHLVAEASAAALSQVSELMANAASGTSKPEGLEKMVQIYLSEFHRDNPQVGCAFGAMGSELARADLQTRTKATDGFLEMVDIIAAKVTGVAPGEAKQQAMVTLFTMIGALTMARVVVDRTLSDSILSTTADLIASTRAER